MDHSAPGKRRCRIVAAALVVVLLVNVVLMYGVTDSVLEEEMFVELALNHSSALPLPALPNPPPPALHVPPPRVPPPSPPTPPALNPPSPSAPPNPPSPSRMPPLDIKFAVWKPWPRVNVTHEFMPATQTPTLRTLPVGAPKPCTPVVPSLVSLEQSAIGMATYFIPSIHLTICVPSKVGGTSWAQFVRRAQGAANWHREPHEYRRKPGFVPTIPPKSEWIAAAWFRHPVTRAFSAYNYIIVKNCRLVQCPPPSFARWIDTLYAYRSHAGEFNDHWAPYYLACGLDTIDHDPYTFVGRLEHAQEDAQCLLRQIPAGNASNAWDVYGSTDWCPRFTSAPHCPTDQPVGAMFDIFPLHATHSANKLREISRSTFETILKIYEKDMTLWAERSGWEYDYDQFMENRAPPSTP